MTTLENNQQRKDKVYFYDACQSQGPDQYTRVNDKSLPYFCEDCGFGPCICKHVTGYEPRTGLFIVEGDL